MGFKECHTILNSIVKVDNAFGREAVLRDRKLESNDVFKDTVVAEHGKCLEACIIQSLATFGQMNIRRIYIFWSLDELEIGQDLVIELGTFNLIIIEIIFDIVQTALRKLLLLLKGFKYLKEHNSFRTRNR